jgi:hypothetical protein
MYLDYDLVNEQNLNLKCLKQTKIPLIDIRKKQKFEIKSKWNQLFCCFQP